MIKEHKCKSQRAGAEGAAYSIEKEGNMINIKRAGLTYTDVLVDNIRWCPFCGVDLKAIKG